MTLTQSRVALTMSLCLASARSVSCQHTAVVTQLPGSSANVGIWRWEILEAPEIQHWRKEAPTLLIWDSSPLQRIPNSRKSLFPESPQPDRLPTTFELAATSVGGATGGGLIGGFVGFAIDGLYCQRHHGREPSFIFGPCTFYVGAASATGWFAGAPVGATWGAARIAERRGCPHETAITRSALGAVIGLAPDLVLLAPRSAQYPPLRSVLIAGAPVLSGLGAALAVHGCHAP